MSALPLSFYAENLSPRNTHSLARTLEMAMHNPAPNALMQMHWGQIFTPQQNVRGVVKSTPKKTGTAPGLNFKQTFAITRITPPGR